MERQLVTIRKISDLAPIPGADRIECAKIDGWKVVVEKGVFNVGDECVFIEIDSVLPDVEPFKFLVEKNGKTFYNGKFGARLRTVRLRKQLSQGLALPLSAFRSYDLLTGKPLEEELGIWKYDPPPPAELAGMIAGSWPSWLQKTDQERVQNLDPAELVDGEYIMEEKMDGSSMSVWIDEHGTLGVCSRNVSLKIDEPANATNAYIRMAHDSGMLGWLKSNILPQDTPFALQGELCGPSIQGNPYNLDRATFFLFDVYAPRKGGKLPWMERDDVLENMQLSGVKIRSVPTTGNIALASIDGDKVEGLLKLADGKSMVGDCPREGIVLKSIHDGNLSFKIISNAYLLNEK